MVLYIELADVALKIEITLNVFDVLVVYGGNINVENTCTLVIKLPVVTTFVEENVDVLELNRLEKLVVLEVARLFGKLYKFAAVHIDKLERCGLPRSGLSEKSHTVPKALVSAICTSVIQL